MPDTQRKEIEGVDIRMNIDDARKKFMNSKLSKLVVYEGNIDHVLGYIHQLDLFKAPALHPGYSACPFPRYRKV